MLNDLTEEIRANTNSITSLKLEKENPPTISVLTKKHYKKQAIKWKHIRENKTLKSGTALLQKNENNQGIATITFESNYLFLKKDTITVDLINKVGKIIDSHRKVIDKNINANNPILYGVVDQTILQGVLFDPMLGVSAIGVSNQNISEFIIISGTVDINTPGLYVLTYSVTDPLTGLTTTATRSIIVEPNK